MRTYVWEGGERQVDPKEIAVDGSAVGTAWRDQTVLTIEDLSTEKRFWAEVTGLRQREIRAYCALPLSTSRDKPGALGLGSKFALAFGGEEVHFLSRVAAMIALCFDETLSQSALIAERDRLLALEKERARTSQVSTRRISPSGAMVRPGESRDLRLARPSEFPETGDPVWYGAAEALIESEQLLSAYFRASRVGLCILDTDLRFLAINQTLAEMNGIPAETHLGRNLRQVLGEFGELVEPYCRRVLETREPVLNLELSFNLPNRSEPGYWMDHLIPIKDATGEVKQIGAIVVERTEQKRLEESLRDVSENLRLEKKRQQVLLEVSRTLAENWDLRRAFPRISAYLRRFLRQEYAALSLRDEKNGQLVRHAMDFPMGRNPSVGDKISTATGPGSKALEERSPLILSRDEMQSIDPGIADGLMAEGIRSLCCVPLLRPKGPLGVLVLGSTRANAFRAEDLTLLNQVAALLAIALENARIGSQMEQLKSRMQKERKYLEGEPQAQLHFEEIIGESAELKQVLNQVATVATSDASVLILGETGTGKGLVARALHRASRRAERAFVSLNCAAIPTGLLESELFGHEKGAFTGAVNQKVGRLELADKGTLFLDEIGEIPLEVQPKLLRVLQDHEFERLGGTRTIQVDLRLIAATNRDLGKSVIDKEFRSDLFYRLNVFPIRLPSLRERREDIPMLVRYFVQKFARRMERNIVTVPIETMETLKHWHWPGNVRELENFIERSVILTEGTALRAPLDELHVDSPGSASANQSLERAEREHIVRILRRTGGIIAGPRGAASQLGLKRTTLQSKMQRLGISREEFSSSKSD